jgi:hypothetical protein
LWWAGQHERIEVVKLVPGNSGRCLLIATAVVTLAACAGGVTVSGHKNVSGNYRVSELYVVATRDNELRTVILGDPFNMPKAEFDAAVLASMKGRNFGPTLNLSTNPKQEDSRKRHVVIAFNITEAIDADDVCRGLTTTTKLQQAAGDMTVTGVYCAGNLPLTQATARAGQVTGIDSEQFNNLMGQLTIALFPARGRRNRSQD